MPILPTQFGRRSYINVCIRAAGFVAHPRYIKPKLLDRLKVPVYKWCGNVMVMSRWKGMLDWAGVIKWGHWELLLVLVAIGDEV